MAVLDNPVPCMAAWCALRGRNLTFVVLPKRWVVEQSFTGAQVRNPPARAVALEVGASADLPADVSDFPEAV